MTGSCEAEQETHLEDVGTPPLFGLARASSNTHTPTRTHTSWAQTGTQLNLSSLIYDSDTLEEKKKTPAVCVKVKAELTDETEDKAPLSA